MFSDEDIIFDDDDSDQFSEDDTESAIEMFEASSSREESEKVDFSFEILPTEKIVQHMTNCIQEVNTVVEIPATITRILLNHFKWDKQKLMDRYYDDDQENLFKEANLIDCFKQSIAIGANGSADADRSMQKSQNTTENCKICYLTLSSSELTGLQCGHRFCLSCWNNYLTIKIMIEGIAQTIECPNNSCNILIDDVTIMDIVKDPKVKQRYQLLITNIFVDCNKLLRWCPIPKCGHAVKVQYIDAKPVICNCKHIFCFRCGENWHAPVNCNILRKWNQKCKEDTGTSKWMALNTKPCPKCQALIQKIDGCNYMRCPRCSTPFCWFCLHPWKHAFHSWNNCKQLNRKKIADTKYAQEKTKTDLEKYIFYKDKYMHHMFFLKHEDILHDKVEEKTKEMQNLNKSWIEVQFLKTAADILCYCRRILMYTYVFAYYIQQNNQTVILEDNLQDLENAVEILVGYLHQDVDEQNLSDMNQKVRNQYNYCDSRRKVLLEHVQEGNDKHWWTFDD